MKKHLGLGTAFRSAALGAVLALASVAAQAQMLLYEFGYQLSHPSSTIYQPTDTFATLSVSTYDNVHYMFDLQALPTMGNLFGNTNASIGAVVFNTGSESPVVSGITLAAGSWGVDNIWYLPYNMQLGGIVFDFTEALFGSSHANDSISSGERVVWMTTFSEATSFAAPPFALKVFGIGSEDSSYAFYAPTSVSPIPEPETYAMMLAGLGMLGFGARRRQKKYAAAA
jgi:hypothetical protein